LESKIMSGKTILWGFGILGGIAVMLFVGGWAFYRWEFPYGHTHSCDKILEMALHQYAEEHGGFYPSGEATPEASLSLLYPKYADASALSGKIVPVERVQEILDQGKRLDPDSCGWHYVEGLTLNDNRRLAIFWDKVGLGHNGQRLRHGGHSVAFVGGEFAVISAQEWPQFLEEQEKLLASRDETAIKGKPILVANIRLPSGELTDHFDGAWQLDESFQSFDAMSSGNGMRAGPSLSPLVLRWHRGALKDGTTTFVLSIPEKAWRSKPITVKVRDGKAGPSSITFEMASLSDKP
jgi:hypothetical protein